MRTLIKLIPLVLFGVASGVQACGSIKQDDQDYATGGRRLPVVGVIEGSVLYQGPKPCSANGHIIGAALMLVFDAKNPPPPDGLATNAVNFVAVSGDTLFADQPRETGSTPYCPKDNGDTAIVTATAPYAISPMAAGQYIMQSFYDYTGDFLPTFSFRRLPVAGDIAGGHIDTNDANALITVKTSLVPKSSLANYTPVFQKINIGVQGDTPADSVRGIPNFTMPDTGFVASNVSVAIGLQLPFPRPYFWADGADARGPDPNDPDRDRLPIKTVPQDLQVYAKPVKAVDAFNETLVNEFQDKFPSVLLHAGLPAAELPNAIDPAGPFHLQLAPTPAANGIFVWWNGNHTDFGGSSAENFVPEGTIPRLWPLAVFAKLKDDPNGVDPEGLLAQGSDGLQPIVIIQGITLAAISGSDPTRVDSLFGNVATPAPTQPSAATRQDHVTILVRPSALCLDPRHPDRGGILVTPHTVGAYPPGNSVDNVPNHPLVVPADLVNNPQLKYLLKSNDPDISFKLACLPKGRYGINLVYPTGQAWTTPNEMGSCAAKEGASSFDSDPGSCADQPRPVLYSQGNRAVIEIGAAEDQAWCDANPTPDDCMVLAPE